MNFIQLFKAAITNPKDLIHGKEKSLGKTLLYILLLSILMCIPLMVELTTVVSTIQKDILKITEKMPNFTIKDNQLATDVKKSGFIYQTDYMIFTFDPDGERASEEIEKDLMGNTIGVGLLKNEFVFAISQEHLLFSVLPKNVYTFQYKQIDQKLLTKNFLLSLTSTNQKLSLYFIPLVFAGLIPIFLDFLITLLLISLIGNLFRRRDVDHPLKFLDMFKIVTFSSTLPVITSIILGVLFPSFNSNFLVMITTLFIYNRATIQPPPDASL